MFFIPCILYFILFDFLVNAKSANKDLSRRVEYLDNSMVCQVVATPLEITRIKSTNSKVNIWSFEMVFFFFPVERRMNEFLCLFFFAWDQSTELNGLIVVPCLSGRETRNFAIKWADKSQITTVKCTSWWFEHSLFVLPQMNFLQITTQCYLWDT